MVANHCSIGWSNWLPCLTGRYSWLLALCWWTNRILIRILAWALKALALLSTLLDSAAGVLLECCQRDALGCSVRLLIRTRLNQHTSEHFSWSGNQNTVLLSPWSAERLNKMISCRNRIQNWIQNPSQRSPVVLSCPKRLLFTELIALIRVANGRKFSMFSTISRNSFRHSPF